MAQTFFETGQHGFVVACFEINDAVGLETGLGQRRCKKVRSGDAPKNFTARSGGNACGEQRRCRAVYSAVAAACYFMQCAKGQTAPRQVRIKGGKPERQNRYRPPVPPFNFLNLGAQILNGGRGPHNRFSPVKGG